MDRRPPRAALVGTLITFVALSSACVEFGTSVAVLDDGAASLTISVEGGGAGTVPEQIALDVGDSISLAATGTNVLGLAVQIAAVSWASSDVAVATVASDGLVRAIGPGTAGILAAADGVTASVTAVVSDTVAAFPAPTP